MIEETQRQKLPSCVHGIIGECEKCTILELIKSYIDNKYKYQAMHQENLDQWLEKLQTTVNYINENLRNACSRIEKLEDLFAGRSFKPIHDAPGIHIEKFNERLNNLESSDFDERIHDLESMSIEQRLLVLEHKINNIIEHTVPFKCPICNGLGHIGAPEFVNALEDTYQNGMVIPKGSGIWMRKECDVCKGQKVIWR